LNRGIASTLDSIALARLPRARAILAPIGLGILLGLTLLFARGLPARWTGLVILATLAPTVVILVNDMSKLLLIALVIDIPLGLDIALADQAGHRGGASGFVVSLMLPALIVGYALWLTRRRVGDTSRINLHMDITTPALVYLFTQLVSTFQASSTRLSIAQVFLEVQFFLMYFYVINHVKNWAKARLVFTTLVVCLIVESMLMLLQYVTGFELAAFGVESQATGSSIASAAARVAGTLGSSNAAATFLAASVAITFALYLTDGWMVDKRLALGGLLLGILALMATQSRSGWLAFALTMLILTTRALRKRIGTRAILLLGAVALLLGIGFSQQIQERFTTDDEGSADTRVYHTQWAFNILEDHMFTGVGVNNMWLVALQRDYLPLELAGRKQLNVIHNKYLLVWVELGLFGFMAFLWFLLAACVRALRALIRARDAKASITLTGLLAALVVYLAHMASDPFGARARPQFMWFIIALIAAISQLARERGKEAGEEATASSKRVLESSAGRTKRT
jgi:putative inorganic carbon (HCO3(-)) transporter